MAPRAVAPVEPDSGERVTIAVLRVTDARVFPESELVAATGFKPGSSVSLQELRTYAARIAAHYRAHGYFLAEAHVPAQTVENGVVTLAVVEGRYGRVTVRNASSLQTPVAERLLRGLDPGDAVALAPLESRLLQLADLPGVIVRSTLMPGASVGASDLVVDIAPGDPVQVSVDADNAGSRYTGRHRGGATLRLNDPFGLGDVATLRGFTSGEGLLYGRGAWQRQVGRGDAGFALTALRYRIGKEFASLDAHGTAQVASLYGRYPLRRSRAANLNLVLSLDAKRFSDRIDTTPAIVAERHATVGTVSLVGDLRDGLGGGQGGLTRASLGWVSGSLAGHYNKFTASLSRLQQVNDVVSISASLEGQLATRTNLDVSEKFGLGGSAGVRAYPEGEAYVDEGYLASVETRFRVTPHWQAFGFADSGTGRAANDTRTLSAAGIGVTWFDSHHVVRAVYARKLGSAAATSAPDSDSRVWISAIRNF